MTHHICESEKSGEEEREDEWVVNLHFVREEGEQGKITLHVEPISIIYVDRTLKCQGLSASWDE